MKLEQKTNAALFQNHILDQEVIRELSRALYYHRHLLKLVVRVLPDVIKTWQRQPMGPLAVLCSLFSFGSRLQLSV